MVDHIVKQGERLTTVKLGGDICKVVFDRKFRCFNVINRGSDTVVVSFNPDVNEDDDGVTTIEKGEAVMLAFVKETDTIYVNGIGKVKVSAGYIPVNTFCGNAAGSGGSSGDIIAPDDAELVEKGDIDDLFPDGGNDSNNAG